MLSKVEEIATRVDGAVESLTSIRNGCEAVRDRALNYSRDILVPEASRFAASLEKLEGESMWLMNLVEDSDGVSEEDGESLKTIRKEERARRGSKRPPGSAAPSSTISGNFARFV